jgi:hypothetical protein
MRKKAKEILWLTAVTIGAVALIVAGGIWERGYYWPESEVFIGLGMTGYIGYRIFRKEEKA